MAIEWSNLMSVNIPEIDAQHQELINTVNSIGDLLQNEGKIDEVGNILHFAAQYAQTHFRSEEAYFENYHCPDAETNKAEHAKFIVKFTSLLDEFQTKGADFLFVFNVYKELSDWLAQHILGVDVKLRSYVPRE